MLQSGALAEMVEDNTPWWQVRIEKQRMEQNIVDKNFIQRKLVSF